MSVVSGVPDLVGCQEDSFALGRGALHLDVDLNTIDVTTEVVALVSMHIIDCAHLRPVIDSQIHSPRLDSDLHGLIKPEPLTPTVPALTRQIGNFAMVRSIVAERRRNCVECFHCRFQVREQRQNRSRDLRKVGLEGSQWTIPVWDPWEVQGAAVLGLKRLPQQKDRARAAGSRQGE